MAMPKLGQLVVLVHQGRIGTIAEILPGVNFLCKVRLDDYITTWLPLQDIAAADIWPRDGCRFTEE